MPSNELKAKRLLQHKSEPAFGTYDIANALEDLNKDVHKVEIQGAELVTIKGQKGDKGDRGERGERGPEGKQGKPGKDSKTPGPQGIQGLQGPRGLDGDDGPQGPRGEKGDKGDPGEHGSPDTPEQVRDKLETLEDDQRLDATAIRNLDKAVQTHSIGGVVARNLYQMGDANIVEPASNQLLQYNGTLWINGIAITVSATEPTSPNENDLWVDIS